VYPNFRWKLAARRPIEAYPTTLEHIGHHLLRRRLDLGLKQKEAAQLLGVHPGSLENWEHGRAFPADRLMPALIRFLGYVPLRQPRTIGERVAYERIVRGLSRKRLAASAGVDEGTLSRIEGDSPRLAQRSLVGLLATLGITSIVPADWLGGTCRAGLLATDGPAGERLGNRQGENSPVPPANKGRKRSTTKG
jgi:transcriptional regulator with XRE-family HTH domain